MHKASPPTGQTVQFFEGLEEANQWVVDQYIGRHHPSSGEGPTSRTSRITESPAKMHPGGGASKDNHVVGLEPSTGKDNLICGTRVMSEGTLRQRFCFYGLPAEVKWRLGDQVMDAVA
jgi:hypothetical protein